MDTHRRSGQQAAAAVAAAAAAAAAAGVCPAGEPTAIYSGVELARLASQNDAEERQPFNTIIGGYPVLSNV